MTAIELVLLALATWRLAYMLTLEVGPFAIFRRLRDITTFGGTLECLYCTSVWCALGLYALREYAQWPLYVLAISGLALMVGRYVDG